MTIKRLYLIGKNRNRVLRWIDEHRTWEIWKYDPHHVTAFMTGLVDTCNQKTGEPHPEMIEKRFEHFGNFTVLTDPVLLEARRRFTVGYYDEFPNGNVPLPTPGKWEMTNYGAIRICDLERFIDELEVLPFGARPQDASSHALRNPRNNSIPTLSPSLMELASWILATELMRRSPNLLRIIETHPGGGQYDCLSIVRTDVDYHLCTFNRLGSFTAFKRFDFGCDCFTQIDVCDRIARGESTRSILDEICTILCLPAPSPLPAATPVSLTYRVIAATLRMKTFSLARWSCLNGFLDSSGFEGCGIRRDLFSPFPTLPVPLSPEKSKNSTLLRASDFWFLCRNDEPIICLEIAGRAYSTKGLMIELQPEYARRRSIYDVVAELDARFLGASHPTT